MAHQALSSAPSCWGLGFSPVQMGLMKLFQCQAWAPLLAQTMGKPDGNVYITGLTATSYMYGCRYCNVRMCCE